MQDWIFPLKLNMKQKGNLALFLCLVMLISGWYEFTGLWGVRLVSKSNGTLSKLLIKEKYRLLSKGISATGFGKIWVLYFVLNYAAILCWLCMSGVSNLWIVVGQINGACSKASHNLQPDCQWFILPVVSPLLHGTACRGFLCSQLPCHQMPLLSLACGLDAIPL